ncbi:MULTISPECIES: glycine cleavage system protein GcvH [Pseudomonas]|uniref:Glycine cleavage system H protein n=1 Tax=Pseudomonas putida TaxID=303 RepID=A0A1X0ZKZ2_PSEPU|nr:MULTISPECIES: glycine cleavage system protein GcvH [Pseudomonas]KAF0253114.1 glycine cleavage system protein GcvH [Pseudomonas putida]KWW12681.1 glycine cleavage system protein H [Pseudomonas putida]MBS5846198.1 glycine cleavage system protein GcvH [Pseudomonas putida]MCE0880282.1 glycine cleavage system protein GcvH [Pseudomonas putida]MCE0957725.1 glycine cleavage system protein GcvH [Pseudomonas putida]
MSTLRFTPEHEWLRLEATGELTVGITSYAQQALGDVVFVQLPEPGEYGEGNELAVLESVKAASNITMPVTGTVVAVNQALAEDPELINASPMQDGWFFRIQASNPADLDSLMDQDGYERFLADNA